MEQPERGSDLPALVNPKKREVDLCLMHPVKGEEKASQLAASGGEWGKSLPALPADLLVTKRS